MRLELELKVTKRLFEDALNYLKKENYRIERLKTVID